MLFTGIVYSFAVVFTFISYKLMYILSVVFTNIYSFASALSKLFPSYIFPSLILKFGYPDISSKSLLINVFPSDKLYKLLFPFIYIG